PGPGSRPAGQRPQPRPRRARSASGSAQPPAPPARSSCALPARLCAAHHGLSQAVLLGRIFQGLGEHGPYLDRHAAADEAALAVDADKHIVLIALTVGEQRDLDQFLVLFCIFHSVFLLCSAIYFSLQDFLSFLAIIYS